jgi:hypothetical protein
LRNLYRAVEHVERAFAQNLDAPPQRAPWLPLPKSPTAWRAADARPQAGAESEVKVSSAPEIKVNAPKVTIVVPSEQVAALQIGEATARVKFTVSYDTGTLRIDVNGKSLRKAHAAIRANGAANIICLLQGKLGRGELLDCGLTTQQKMSRPAPPPQAA